MATATHTDANPTTLLETAEFYQLWALALLTYGIGDTVSTVALMELAPGIREANALVAFAAETYGHAGIAGVKVAVFLCCLAISVYGARIERDAVLYYAPMVLLAVVGAFTTVFNVRLLLG